jgi:hypothetical protein
MEKGGEGILIDGQQLFKVAQQSPQNVYPLVDLDGQIASFSNDFDEIMKEGILNPADKKQNAKAVYLAICLDKWTDYASEHPEKWAEAKKSLEGYWKIQQNIFYQSSFYSKDLLREKFEKAGFVAPQQQLSDSVVWNDSNVWKVMD